MRSWQFLWTASGVLLVAAPYTATGWAQAPRREVVKATSISGKVIRVDAEKNQFAVQTKDGKEVILYSEQQVTYRSNDRKVRLADLREGMGITVSYYPKDRRNIVNSITLADERTAEAGDERRAEDSTDAGAGHRSGEEPAVRRDRGSARSRADVRPTADRSQRSERSEEPGEANKEPAATQSRDTDRAADEPGTNGRPGARRARRSDDPDRREDDEKPAESRSRDSERPRDNARGDDRSTESRAQGPERSEHDRRVEAGSGAVTPTGGTRVRGRIARVQSDPGQLILTTADGRQLVLDLDEGQDVTVQYETRGGRRIVRSIAPSSAEAPRPGEQNPAGVPILDPVTSAPANAPGPGTAEPSGPSPQPPPAPGTIVPVSPGIGPRPPEPTMPPPSDAPQRPRRPLFRRGR